MNEFPLPNILEFIRTVVPFDTLSREDLARVVGQMEIAYYPRGEAIVRQGDKHPIPLHIIQVGSVRITIPDNSGGETLVDIRGKGDVFGATSLLSGAGALFNVTADEDLIAFLLRAGLFKELVDSQTAFQQFFNFSLAQNIRLVRQSAEYHLPQHHGINTSNSVMFLIDKRVADLMIANVITCSPTVSVRAAVQQMAERQVGSIVIKRDMSPPLGILTDTDLRTKVLATGHSIDAKVTEVMSRPLHSIHPQAYSFDALLKMSRHGVSHLVVTEDDRLVGIITEHDLRMETGSSPVGVIGDIEKSLSLDELVSLRPKITHVLEMLLRQGGSVKQMVDLITELNDRVTLKLLKITEMDIEKQGLGHPPVPYCWMALGSEGRREQTLLTDQDNALVFATVPQEHEEKVKQWFIMFSELVVQGLVRYGFPPCPGGIMASNARWCQTEAQWQNIFLDWIEDPNPLTLRMASIFFDFRALYAGTDFLERLRDRVNRAIKRSRLFLRFMAKNGLHNRPPLGFLRQFVVEKSGEHKNKLNLKMRGLTPVIDSARVMALERGVITTNTFERLSEINKAGVLSDELYSDLRDAYAFINLLRISRHLEASANGKEPDNFVDPATLNSLQRKMLKESFAAINRLQETLEFRYQTQFVLEA